MSHSKFKLGQTVTIFRNASQYHLRATNGGMVMGVIEDIRRDGHVGLRMVQPPPPHRGQLVYIDPGDLKPV